MPTKPTGRPRGRPKGSKNLPSPTAFVLESLTLERHPAEPEATKRKPGGPWANMTPEQRSAHARKLTAMRKHRRGGGPKGIPRDMTVAEFNAALEAQKPIVQRIMRKMKSSGLVPEDPMAEEALKAAMTVLRSPVTPKDKIAAARLVLDFTKTKPTTKIEHTVKSAEDLLDEMAEEDPE